jgi:hypothetical protein
VKRGSFKKDQKAVSVWLRKGEIEAMKITSKPFNKNGFLKVLQEIKSLTPLDPLESIR